MFDTFKTYFSKLKRYFPWVHKNRYLIGGILVVLIFGATILRIDSLASPGLIELKKVDFDEDAIERINDLKKTDVNVKENIDESRTNPF